MPVAEYVPVLERNLHAVLWTGKDTDFSGMPNIESYPGGTDGDNLVIHYEGERIQVARPNEHYIVRGITGYFSVMEKEKFEQTYIPVTLLKEAYPKILEDALTILKEQIWSDDATDPQEKADCERDTNAAYAWLKHIKAMRPAPTPLWTPQHVTNVLGSPVLYWERGWVEYGRAVNLCNRIIGHYETSLEMARWAFATLKTTGDWRIKFPPEWDKYPWANYACLLHWRDLGGSEFRWGYFENMPRHDVRSNSYRHHTGKWVYDLDSSFPLSEILNLRETLERRP